MQIFSESVKKLWNEWQVRGMVLLSLSLQIILIIFGSRRKYTTRIWIRIIVWSAYLTADWVATVTLGNLATSEGGFDDDSNNVLEAFWAPFLLMHLGGPDCITAYSLEDNELWLRHFLGFIVQVGMAFYILLRSWSNNALTFIAIPVFIAGISKYGERTWVLRCSSTKYFRDSLLSAPEPGPDITTFADGTVLVKKEETIEETMPNVDPEAHYLYVVEYLFKTFKYLFADLILGYPEQKEGYSIMHNKSAEDAFKLVEVELGFMYDVLYTKAIIVYSQLGIFLRCISTLSTISALIAFSVVIGKYAHPITDISITYALLVGAIFLEVYAFFVLIFSDWTKVWWIKCKKPQANPTPGVTSPQSHSADHKRWSRSMAQCNLISFCLNDKPMKCVGVQKLLGIKETLEKYWYISWEEVNADLQVLVFSQLREKANKIRDDDYDIKLCEQLLAHRGDYVLEKKKCLNEFKWTTIDVDFDHSFLIWHIATDICFYDDLKSRTDSKCQISKLLSDYMLYLIVIYPFMLPAGIGEIRYRDTCAATMRLFKQRGGVITNNDASSALLGVYTDMSLEEYKGDKSMSVLFYGCKLAKQLRGNERKWEMISEVWVEMLAYAASHCGWKEHAQQLRKGGELLTHVCLLMAHLGLSKQYQIEKQYTYDLVRKSLPPKRGQVIAKIMKDFMGKIKKIPDREGPSSQSIPERARLCSRLWRT